MKKTGLICILFLVTFCDPPVKTNLPTLDGFAFYQSREEGQVSQRAVSPEGVILQISSKDNYPEKADKNFWAEAIRSYLPQKGYKMTKEGGTQKGRYFIFLVPGIKYDYFYFIHFSVQDKKIILTESGGQYALLKDYEEKLISFVSKN